MLCWLACLRLSSAWLSSGSSRDRPIENAFGRQVAEEHLAACIKAGIKISGINAEVAPGQWEFQIGPAEGIEAGDHLWVARYLLERISEKHNVSISYDPNPIAGDWNGSRLGWKSGEVASSHF